MLKRAIANAHRHGINLKVGTLNPAMGDCAYQAVRENINDRDCFTEMIGDSADKCRKKWIEKAEAEANLIDQVYMTPNWQI